MNMTINYNKQRQTNKNLKTQINKLIISDLGLQDLR